MVFIVLLVRHYCSLEYPLSRFVRFIPALGRNTVTIIILHAGERKHWYPDLASHTLAPD